MENDILFKKELLLIHFKQKGVVREMEEKCCTEKQDKLVLPEMDQKIVQNERQNNVAIKSNDVVDGWKHQNVFIKLDLLST